MLYMLEKNPKQQYSCRLNPQSGQRMAIYRCNDHIYIRWCSENFIFLSWCATARRETSAEGEENGRVYTRAPAGKTQKQVD